MDDWIYKQHDFFLTCLSMLILCIFYIIGNNDTLNEMCLLTNNNNNFY